jgi:hypothetical protein
MVHFEGRSYAVPSLFAGSQAVGGFCESVGCDCEALAHGFDIILGHGDISKMLQATVVRAYWK